MKTRELLGKLNRVQQSLIFKLIATALVIGVVVTVYLVSVAAQKGAAADERIDETTPSELVTRDPEPGATDQEKVDQALKKELADTYAAQVRFYNRLVDQRFDSMTVGLAALAASVPILAAVWLGIGLTLLFYVGLGAALCWPMLRFGSEFWRGIGAYVAGVVVLAVSFSMLVQALRLALSASHPVTAIARNVLAEAVRMKISLVFIVILILGLAALPGVLEPNTPLRYRVQSFLQYGATGAYWISAVLVLFLSAATVAFEQRDKIIWQTMTKPVRTWQYVLGKWLGVVGLAAVLLGVSCAGVFLFTEYLRRTHTAVDEVAPYVSAKGAGQLSEDRLMLETQVLVGRKTVRPSIPVELGDLIEKSFEAKYKEAAAQYKGDPKAYDPPNEAKIRREVEGELLSDFLSVAPGDGRTFEFIDLVEARSFSVPLTLRYKVNAGANNPTDFFVVSLFVEQSGPLVRSVPLGQVLTMPLSNAAVRPRPGASGPMANTLKLTVVNGDLNRRTPNPQTISFAPDGLQLSYAVSSFQANFLRVALVMWLKLAFLSMLAIVTATFLAFPVACLVSFGAFMLAEASGYLTKALDYFSPDPESGVATKVGFSVIEQIGRVLTSIFRFYGDLSPTSDLVEGKVVPWGTVGYALALLGLLTVVMWMTASVILRNRELATYSGQ